MHTVGISDAASQLTTLLDEVERGGEVMITRHGKPVARLVPPKLAPAFNRGKAQHAARALLQASAGLSLGGLSIKELIDDGRQ